MQAKTILLTAAVLGALVAAFIVYKVTPNNKVYYDLSTPFSSPLKVTHLNLEDNQLTQLPDNMATLKNLTILNLNKNRLKILPSHLTKLEKLRSLHLNYNGIDTINNNIANLQQLQELNLAWNELIEFPLAITKLPNLENLDLTGNAFIEVPKSIQKLNKTLKTLDLSYTPISLEQIKQVQTWLPTTKVIYTTQIAKDNFKKFYASLSEETSIQDLYTIYSTDKLKWISKHSFYKELVNAQCLTDIASQLLVYPSYITNRLHAIQELCIEDYVSIQQLEKVLPKFPNLKGISLENNLNIDTLLKYIATTNLEWVKLCVNIDPKKNIVNGLPNAFNALPQTKILAMQKFKLDYSTVSPLAKFPKLKNTVDALCINNASSFPLNFEDLPPTKVLFARNTNNWYAIPKLKGLEFLDISDKDVFMLDLVFLKEIPQLQELHINNGNLQQLEKYLLPILQDLKQLKVLSIKGHIDKNVDKEAFQAALPNVKIIGL